MYDKLSRLVIYSSLNEDEILSELYNATFFLDKEEGGLEHWRKTLCQQVSKLIKFSVKHGFTGNLWHDYLVFRVLMDENPFTIGFERRDIDAYSPLSCLAKKDFKLLRKLFDFNFKAIEEKIGLSFYEEISDFSFSAAAKKSTTQDQAVCRIAKQIAENKDSHLMFDIFSQSCREFGAGELGYSKAFRLSGTGDGLEIRPIIGAASHRLSDIVGYEVQKQALKSNTEAFLEGKPCNNVLLYGDSGTGKSTSVKALLDEYYDRGLRMVEIYKHQFHDISGLIARIKDRNYRFIIFIDDLSFEENETEYKFLKAVIEGGVETKPENVLIYATSNRRHLIRETWNDRSDTEHNGEIHRSDTVEEKLSLASRFGIGINFSQPGRAQYHEIVRALAAKYPEICLEEEELFRQADAWDIRHGGMSGRTAEQFIKFLAGKTNNGGQANDGNT